MNYQLHYDLLIEKYGTWEKPKEVYTERHRKLPGYLGGKYVKGNAFYMTARAHFVAHLLWAKITGHAEAWLPVKLMLKPLTSKTSRLYELSKIRSIGYLRKVLNRYRKKSGDNAFINKKGVHGASSEQREAWAAAGGISCKTKGVGVHSASHNELSEWGRRANGVKYECKECGMVSTPGALGRHQTSSGHVGRVKAS